MTKLWDETWDIGNPSFKLDLRLRLSEKWRHLVDVVNWWTDALEVYMIICVASLGCTVYVVVLLLPLYTASKDYYGTFAHQYA